MAVWIGWCVTATALAGEATPAVHVPFGRHGVGVDSNPDHHAHNCKSVHNLYSEGQSVSLASHHNDGDYIMHQSVRRSFAMEQVLSHLGLLTNGKGN